MGNNNDKYGFKHTENRRVRVRDRNAYGLCARGGGGDGNNNNNEMYTRRGIRYTRSLLRRRRFTINITIIITSYQF